MTGTLIKAPILLVELSSSSPADAFRLCLELGEVASPSLSVAVSSWVDRDPDAAAAAIRAMLSAEQRSEALYEVAAGIAADDPMEAAHLATLLESGSYRTEIMRRVASELANEDVEVAAAWAVDLERYSERTEALQSVVGRWASIDPEAAADFINPLPDDELRSTVEESLVRHWADDSPAAAAEWMRRNGRSRHASRELVMEWVTHNGESAARWAESLPAGELFDGAMEALAYTTNRRAPAEAFDWALRIGDEQRRSSMLRLVVRDWLSSDPATAREHVARADLTSQQRALLLGS